MSKYYFGIFYVSVEWCPASRLTSDDSRLTIHHRGTEVTELHREDRWNEY
jgi:hypothetical protein